MPIFKDFESSLPIIPKRLSASLFGLEQEHHLAKGKI